MQAHQPNKQLIKIDWNEHIEFKIVCMQIDGRSTVIDDIMCQIVIIIAIQLEDNGFFMICTLNGISFKSKYKCE